MKKIKIAAIAIVVSTLLFFAYCTPLVPSDAKMTAPTRELQEQIAIAITQADGSPDAYGQVRSIIENSSMDYWERRHRVTIEGGVIEIRSSGPDRVWETKDDITFTLNVSIEVSDLLNAES